MNKFNKYFHIKNATSLFNILAFTFIFLFTLDVNSQVVINGKVYYDNEDKKPAEVKLLKDNLPFKQFETSSTGTFNVKLPVGHDYMFEISKPYSYTTRLAVSTKFPDRINTDDLFETFKVETDLLPKYEGIDGSIMANPIMILRFKEEENAFVNDTEYLDKIRADIEALLNEIDKMEKEGFKQPKKKLSKKEMDRIDVIEFIEEEKNSKKAIDTNATKSSEKEIEKVTADTSALSDEKNTSSKNNINNTKSLSENDNSSLNDNEMSNENSTVNSQTESETGNNSSQNQSNDTSAAYVESDMDRSDSIEVTDKRPNSTEDNAENSMNDDEVNEQDLENDEPFYKKTWFYILVIVSAGLILWLLARRKKDENEIEQN